MAPTVASLLDSYTDQVVEKGNQPALFMLVASRRQADGQARADLPRPRFRSGVVRTTLAARHPGKRTGKATARLRGDAVVRCMGQHARAALPA